jgi:hypothetical protein
MPTKKKVVEAITSASAQALADVSTSAQAEAGPVLASASAQVQEEPPKAKPKRASAAAKHKIVAVVTSEGIQGSFKKAEPRKPIIVNLPIKSSEVQFYDQPLKYDPEPPKDTKAFNEELNDPFLEESEHYDNNAIVEQILSSFEPEKGSALAQALEKRAHMEEKPAAASAPAQVSKTAREYGPTKLLVEYANTKVTKELPYSVSAACFWTCEPFEGRPCVIPMSIIDGVWHVYGNYCNPQTAMAALLAEPLDTHVRWERIALLNMLYGPSFSQGRIYPAPDRAALQRFGGPMSIEEYRDLCDRSRLRVDIHMPPLISILASMDTKPIDFYESTIGNGGSGVGGGHGADAGGGLKLKRSKPLREKEHTLDTLLGLKK